MKRAGDKFFAAAALPQDEYRAVGIRNLSDEALDLEDRGCSPSGCRHDIDSAPPFVGSRSRPSAPALNPFFTPPLPFDLNGFVMKSKLPPHRLHRHFIVP